MLRLLLCVSEWTVSPWYQLQHPPDQPCGLSWTIQSASFCSHLTDVEVAFPVLKFSLDLKVTFSPVQVLSFQ